MLWYLLLALFLDCIGRGRSIRLSKIQLTWAILRFTYCLFLLIKVLNYNLHNIPVQIIKNHKNDRIMNCAIYWFLIFFSISIGPYIPLRQTSFRLAAGVWCLMSLVLINAYSGNLISYLSVPKLKPVVQSFENLASSLDLKLAIDANSVMANRLLVSEYITI